MHSKTIICTSPSCFMKEADRHRREGHETIIKDRCLYVNGQLVAEYKDARGGAQPGAGRPKTERNTALTVRISQDAMNKLNSITKNKSEFIDALIKNA